MGIERLGVTGGASKASDKCSFAKISGYNKDWCNGRGKPAPLRKARGIVRLWEGWCGVGRWCNDSSIVDSALH